MFGKVEISKLEHRLLLFAILLTPVLAVGFLLSALSTALYELLFPTPHSINFAIDDWGTKPTLPLFRICAVASMTVSFVLVFYKRLFLSILTFILPLASLVPWVIIVQRRVQEILETTRDLETINQYNERSLIEIVFSTLDNLNIVFLSLIVVLFFWQISILLRMLVKTLKKDKALP